MDTPTAQEIHIVGLKAMLSASEARVRQLQADLGETRALLDQMRDQVQDASDMIERWIMVFDMVQDEAGIWKFDRDQTELWNRCDELDERYRKLVVKWNKHVAVFNANVLARNVGRPLAASDAQQDEVRKRHKAGASLRSIAKATALSLRTVRTIVDSVEGKTSKRDRQLRRLEFNRQRAAAFRARKKQREQMGKAITELQKRAVRLIKTANGLDEAAE